MCDSLMCVSLCVACWVNASRASSSDRIEAGLKERLRRRMLLGGMSRLLPMFSWLSVGGSPGLGCPLAMGLAGIVSRKGAGGMVGEQAEAPSTTVCRF